MHFAMIYYLSNHGAKIHIFLIPMHISYKISFIAINCMADSVGRNAEQVGDGVVFVGTEVVDGIADNDVIELGNVKAALGP